MGIKIEAKEILFAGKGRWLPTLRLPLLLGFICPKCPEVLRAYFATNEPVEVWKYEGVEKENQSRYQVFTACGGQGMVSCHHNGDYRCGLQVYWALNLKENLLEWFQEHFKGHRLTTLAELVRKTQAGEVDGLTIVKDMCGSNDTILAYDPSRWEAKWDTRGEEWEDYTKRRDAFLEEKLGALGCVVAESK
jgi:hypothetical protein